jgi:glycosyltransferase involved in cell wall biosynthesis
MQKMPLSKILVVHNSYQQVGGEDAVFAAEATLLRQHGHEVVEYRDNNQRINQISRLSAAAGTIWSRSSHRRMLQTLRAARPDIVHFHNTFLLISPSAYYACREFGVPVVQTLHNYRLLCPAATFFRGGQLCEACLGKTLPWPGVWHACYRKSHSQTTIVAAMIGVHRWLKTWQQQVDIYIALSEFASEKFIKGGIPREKIVIKPNFVNPDPGVGEENDYFALFVGRLSPEKGVWTLLQAWQGLKGIPLKILGDGPLLTDVQHFIQQKKLDCVEVLGQRAHGETLTLMKRARFLIFPSEWYEGFPLTLAEAFACGVPVIAARLGAMAEIVKEGHTGLLFCAGDPQDLAGKVRWAVENAKAMCRMRENARRIYEEKYTAGKNYKMLSAIYEQVIKKSQYSNGTSYN